MEHYAVEWTEWIVRKVLYWEEDDERKGQILRAFHHFGVYALFTLIIISHTLYPAFWLQTIILMFCILVWIHHMLTRGCVISKVEQRLMKDEQSFVDPFMTLFQIEVNEKSKQGILMLGSSLGVALLSLEWISRFSYSVGPLLMKYLIQAPVTAAASSLHIPLPSSSP
jgi:hypothetical protein